MIYFILFVTFVITACSSQRDPEYNGVPLAGWVDSLFQFDETRQLKALEVIGNFGLDAGRVKPIITQFASGSIEDLVVSDIVKIAAQRTLRLIGGTTESTADKISKAQKMEWAEALGPHAKVVVERQVTEKDLASNKTLPLSVMLDALYTTDINKQIIILKRIAALGPDANQAESAISRMAGGFLRDMELSDTVQALAINVLEKIKLPPHMALNNTTVPINMPTPDRFQMLMDSIQTEWLTEQPRDPRAPEDILIDSAKQMAWMGDTDKALKLLREMMRDDSLSQGYRRKVQYNIEAIATGKETIEVKKQ